MSKHLAVIAVILVGLSLGSCDREGPAERAGEQIDAQREDAAERNAESAEKAAEAIEDAGDEVEDKVEEGTP